LRARDALELPAQAEGVDYESQATDRMLALTEGYPYSHLSLDNTDPSSLDSDADAVSDAASEALFELPIPAHTD
jgi:hypothetical protein